ncbi:hypothetical protein SDC9_137246 [bioreactor metagenome]|uniref:Uncharacterized protein n=1 Tax=bioreactor metagenome TaxID=1076179 RepID=A0A645DLF7_9ZZZZ
MSRVDDPSQFGGSASISPLFSKRTVAVVGPQILVVAVAGRISPIGVILGGHGLLLQGTTDRAAELEDFTVEISELPEHVNRPPFFVRNSFIVGQRQEVIVIRILVYAQNDLLCAVEAGSRLGFFPGAIECGQQHSGQYGDDGNYDKQFNKRKLTGNAW